jgi:hypothetical protein
MGLARAARITPTDLGRMRCVWLRWRWDALPRLQHRRSSAFNRSNWRQAALADAVSREPFLMLGIGDLEFLIATWMTVAASLAATVPSSAGLALMRVIFQRGSERDLDAFDMPGTYVEKRHFR